MDTIEGQGLRQESLLPFVLAVEGFTRMLKLVAENRAFCCLPGVRISSLAICPLLMISWSSVKLKMGQLMYEGGVVKISKHFKT